jgi:uncharacterized protein YaeQ
MVISFVFLIFQTCTLFVAKFPKETDQRSHVENAAHLNHVFPFIKRFNMFVL